MHVTPFKADT